MSGRFGQRSTEPSSMSTHSGLTTARQRTVLVWPPNTCVHRPLGRSQMRTVRSVLPLTSVSRVAASAHTPPSCPSSARRSSPVVGEYTWMEWSSEAEMMRPCENSRHVTTDVPCAGNVRCRGLAFVIQRERVRCRLLNSALYGCGGGSAPGGSAPACRRRACSARANARSLSPPNQMRVPFSRSRQRTGSESTIARHAVLTRAARASVANGR
jgi:hypothetical protein